MDNNSYSWAFSVQLRYYFRSAVLNQYHHTICLTMPLSRCTKRKGCASLVYQIDHNWPWAGQEGDGVLQWRELTLRLLTPVSRWLSPWLIRATSGTAVTHENTLQLGHCLGTCCNYRPLQDIGSSHTQKHQPTNVAKALRNKCFIWR